ncbi:2',5'-phosphodiesterase 12-like [Artemia franciscana]|uniref:2',5'-phosphodiesterase 12-like n=1 Tax=Artemia franciscana TaxID=6661 RepID=UPI0032DB12D2
MVLLQFFRRNRSIYSGFSRMDYLNVKISDTSAQFRISFQLVDPNSNFLRVFDFTRPMAETCEATELKIKRTMEKTLAKQYKRLKKTSDEMNITIKLSDNPNKSLISTLDILKDSEYPVEIFNKTYSIVWNTPSVISLKIIKCILVGFPCYPVTKLENADESLAKFKWFRSITSLSKEQQKNVVYERQWTERGKKCLKPMKITPPDETNESQWCFIGGSSSYLPTTEDVDHWLLVECIPKNKDTEGQPFRTVSPVVVSAGPGKCPFEDRHKFTKERVSNLGLRVVTYNLLADLYVNKQFTYCPPYALEIAYRKQFFLKEIIGYNSDLVCLQEVDTKVFDGDLKPRLHLEGLPGIFDKKGGQVSEGLACFYRTDKLRLLQTESFTISEGLQERPIFRRVWETVCRNEKLKNRVLQRTNALQAHVFELIERPDRWLIVGNTHLYSHQDADHIRLLQAGLGMLYFEDLVNTLELKAPDKEIALIFCGDFNSFPSNGVLELMRKQHIPPDHKDWTSNVDEAVEDLPLINPIRMESARGTPLYTNYTDDFKDCLDYIFYQENRFNVSQVVPLPSEEVLSANVGLPSVVFPSDHVSLVADLTWVTNKGS